jgi:hypothetical protein
VVDNSHKAQPEPNAKLVEKQVISEKLIKEKPEKLEHKEKPEKYEHKEKPEKHEFKEKPEKFEHKELLKDFKVEKVEVKESRLEVNKPVFEGNPKDIAEGTQGPSGSGPVEQRLEALEQAVASLNHFISSGQRPDLSRGALAGERDTKKP